MKQFFCKISVFILQYMILQIPKFIKIGSMQYEQNRKI